jgi:hypothetical protein
VPALPEPLWLPAPECPELPVNEIHIWRVRMDELEGEGWKMEQDCPVERDRAEKVKMALFRNDVMGRYLGNGDQVIGGPGAGLRVAMAQCDHLALIAISRNIRGVGLDVERVRADIPIEEMADRFLDAPSQWDLRITWSPREKAWKFFQFWTSNEACTQALPSTRPSHSTYACEVRGFSPEEDFVAALAVEGGQDIELLYWDWQC